jgi:hypothetical protein
VAHAKANPLHYVLLLGIAAVMLAAAGCACGHLENMRTMREQVDLIVEFSEAAAVRSLTPGEKYEFERTQAKVRDLAVQAEEDARARDE